MNQDAHNEVILSNIPLPETKNTVELEIFSDENQLRSGLPQKQVLEGKITLNPARCLIFSIPLAENIPEGITIGVDRTLYELYLVIIPFSLHQAPGNKYYTEMTLLIELADPQHTAFDLCPKNISTQVEGAKTYTLSPQIKFQEAEVATGPAGDLLRFDVLRPTITAEGEGQHTFYWTYKGFEGKKEVAPEVRQILFIAQVPRGTSTLQGDISYEIVLAKKFGREWIFKDCEVAPYSFAWDLSQARPFFYASAFNQSQPARANKQVYMDVCIVCALAEEAEAFISAVEGFCSTKFVKLFDSKNREYRFATIQNNRGEPLKLHVSWPASYGLVETSLYLPAVLSEFHPRIAIMTGICAGDKRKVNLGDIVVADRTFIYDEGKITRDQNGQSSLQSDINMHATHSQVLSSVRMFDEWKPLVSMLGRPLPNCHIAPIASGNAVRSDDPFEQVQRVVRGTVAIDMEGAAFYRCTAEFPTIHALLVKGVCDYGDDHKDDTFHQYAALASALYALAFIKEYVTTTFTPGQAGL